MNEISLSTIEALEEKLIEAIEPFYELDDKPFQYGERDIIFRIANKYEITLLNGYENQRCLFVRKYDEKDDELEDMANISWIVNEEGIAVSEEDQEELNNADRLIMEAIDLIEELDEEVVEHDEINLSETFVISIGE